MAKTKVVVFDFDGTLTYSTDNIWKLIYQALGLPVDKTSSYYISYIDFVNKKFDYSAWVEINQKDFKDAGLTKDILYRIADNIKLINGLKQTLIDLNTAGVKLYVLSGNFVEVIKYVLGDLSEYF